MHAAPSSGGRLSRNQRANSQNNARNQSNDETRENNQDSNRQLLNQQQGGFSSQAYVDFDHAYEMGPSPIQQHMDGSRMGYGASSTQPTSHPSTYQSQYIHRTQDSSYGTHSPGVPQTSQSNNRDVHQNQLQHNNQQSPHDGYNQLVQLPQHPYQQQDRNRASTDSGTPQLPPSSYHPQRMVGANISYLSSSQRPQAHPMQLPHSRPFPSVQPPPKVSVGPHRPSPGPATHHQRTTNPHSLTRPAGISKSWAGKRVRKAHSGAKQVPRAQLRCEWCRLKGHHLGDCESKIDEESFVQGCPACNTLEHDFDSINCPRKRRSNDVAYWLGECGRGKAPIKSRVLVTDLDEFLQNKRCRPHTPAFAKSLGPAYYLNYLTRGGYHRDDPKQDAKVDDPAWANWEEELKKNPNADPPSLLHPEYEQVVQRDLTSPALQDRSSSLLHWVVDVADKAVTLALRNAGPTAASDAVTGQPIVGSSGQARQKRAPQQETQRLGISTQTASGRFLGLSMDEDRDERQPGGYSQNPVRSHSTNRDGQHRSSESGTERTA